MPFLAATAAGIGTMSTMGAVASDMALLGAGVTAASSISSGIQQSAMYKAQARAADYNRQVAEANARAVEESGRFWEEQQREKQLKLRGSQVAAYGKAGVVMEGTPLEVLAETAAEQEQDILAGRYNFATEAARWRSQAGFYGFESSRQRALSDYPIGRGIMGAGTALLITGGNLLTKWDTARPIGKNYPYNTTGNVAWGGASPY